MSEPLQESTRRDLRRLVVERQRDGRVPGVFAGVVRGGGLTWSTGVGARHLDEPDVAPGPDDQFLIASNTKTFTAVLIMRLRDEGHLSLDDPLGRFFPESVHGAITIRQALAHASGMQREPVGDVWETLQNPDVETLVREFEEAERVHPPHRLWHYSNLVYSMLGEVVARVDGRPWAESLRARILDPLGMRRTTVGFDGAHAQGYYVSPYTDVPVPEPVLDLRGMVPCGGLASTGEDLARWSAFVADPTEEVLAPDTLEEMCVPQIMIDADGWTSAMGLGFFLQRVNGRTYVGHTGGMPGHVTALFTDREARTGGVVLTSSSTPPDIAGWAIALADHVTEHDPVELEPWRPGTSVPPELVPLLGRWYTEGSPFDFSVREGRLEARSPQAPKDKPPSVFEPVGEDLYRTVSGREAGELLRVGRDATGAVRKLNWATYLATRQPLAFGQQA
ncbi:CubicO group peptidase, beta-lactamase class C family [Microlunatus sagamiharensis]|uniref:CubicO group peptidase, beta-lactamase class C family n=1 Tax=Microlunatus sagamiharensis TaxID=546874 RepID=A0A1H2LKG4_9ACTN|nr:serine hydrolase domain-containing protein [Microlunatus sagamiharensis]SDU81225.1 CubicO group peptidase, beta-lactamase class C family [Microlunatus sagamiharensis]